MRLLVGTLVLAAGFSAQRANAPADLVRTIVGRLELVRYKAHIKGLAQFGDRMQGTERNRGAIAWLDQQLRSFGYTNVQRHPFMSGSGPLENVYATKIGTTNPGEVYIVSAHMDGRGGGEAADDDGSGCAVVLELARVLGMPDVQTNRSVRFIFWNNEEFGMDGSGSYAHGTGIAPRHASRTEMARRHPARHDDVRSRHASRSETELQRGHRDRVPEKLQDGG